VSALPLTRAAGRIPLEGGGELNALPIAVGVCSTVAVLTVVAPRAALSLLIVVIVVALWLLRPSLGLVALWITWLAVAGVRRALDTTLPVEGYDPLSIAPFAATAAVAGLELFRHRLSVRPERVMVFALLGLAVGIPAGAHNPSALAFALFAYGAGVLSFAIGYAEGRRGGGTDTATRTLTPLLAPLAVYGIAQYLLPLTSWDANWVRESGLTSILVPGDVNHVRVFSTLNSPATFGAILAIGLVSLLARDRLKPGAVLVMALALVALALTYVRMAIPALVLGLLVYAAASRWRAAPRLAVFAAIAIAATLALGATTQAGALVLKRVSTLGSLSADTSANERQTTFWQMLPQAALTPLGHGVGTAGEPSKLADKESFGAAVDNGYLGLLYQLGPLGFGLVAIALASAVGPLVRARPPTPALRRRKELDLAIVATLFVLAAATDVFYGVLGALLWFYLGHGMSTADLGASIVHGAGSHKTFYIDRQAGHA
jgi:O-Antigen ligase